MTWMLTANGRAVDLRFIAQDVIAIDDIAHHLAQINRYTGACVRPYSVAEHSLLVYYILSQVDEISDPAVLLAGLLHDAHEAYTNDLSTPMKQVVGEAWHAEEGRIQHAVLQHFGVATAYTAARTAIRIADMRALVTERQQLLPPSVQWAAEKEYTPVPDVDLIDKPFTWQGARDQFLGVFTLLQARLELARKGVVTA